MAAWTYILYSEKLTRFYIGSTTMSVEERLKKHLGKHKGFTGKVKDWTIYHKEEFETKPQALLRERELKSWKSSERIRCLTNPE